MKKLLLAAGLAASLSASAAAAVLVVKSSGPSAKTFPAGKALGDNQTITLKGNDVIVLLDSRGTRTLRGPGAFNTSASSGGSTSSMAALTGQSTVRRSRVGAVRGTPTGATAGRNIWQADVSRSGNVCVVNPADAGLYRPEADTAGRVMLKEVGGAGNATVEFAAGQRNAAWPDSMPIVPGKRYEVRSSGTPVTLTAKSISPVPAGMEGLAQSLIINGCQAQLDVLIDTFTAPSAG
jgi:hypothetical protein